MFELIILELSALTNLISISIVEAFLAIMLIMAGIILYKTRDFSLFKKSYTIYFGMMILAETLSTIFGVNPANSVRSWSSFWVYTHLFAVYVIYDGKDKEKIFLFFFYALIISGLYAVFFPTKGLIEGRLVGFMSHALTFGNIAGVLFTAAAGFLLFTRPKEKLRLTLFVLFFLTAGGMTVLSGSRGSILAILLTFSAMLIYRFRFKGVAAVIAVVILLTAAVMSDQRVSKRFMKTGSELAVSDSSMGTRLVLWETTTRAIMEKPLFGYGKGNFSDVIKPMLHVPVSSTAHAHNSYIQYTFTNGFFGLVALFLFIAALFRHMGRMIKSNPYAKTAIFILITFMLEGLTENNFSDSEVVMSAFLSIGVLITPVRNNAFHFFSKKEKAA